MMRQEVEVYKDRQVAAQRVTEVTAAINNFAVDFTRCNDKAEVDGYYKQLQHRLNEVFESEAMKHAQRVLALDDLDELYEDCRHILAKIKQTMTVLQERFTLLDSMKFDSHLHLFAQKMTQMQHKEEHNVLHQDATETIRTFHAAIKEARSNFLHNPNPTGQAKAEFKEACHAAIHALKPVLKGHHEWEGIIRTLTFDLTSLFTGLADNKSGLFAVIDPSKSQDQSEQTAEHFLAR